MIDESFKALITWNTTVRDTTVTIQEERLKAAANLLKTTSLPIVEIMQEVGYENITYFYKIFKEKFKITPSIYRNHNLR